MSPQDWLDLSAHNARSPRPPERKVFGRESEPPRRSITVNGAMIVGIIVVSGLVSAALLWRVVRYLVSIGWTL